ncbi:CGI-121 domain containing protein [Trichuris trichiura]|uniref:CGI-121 domain containing protein n=1 Tax=Trichuris trichiura TaxID=36087 RepID=A0A077ZGE3_TRITR|nr:CGI-121 domain containing protein [Trichuris trichiura]
MGRCSELFYLQPDPFDSSIGDKRALRVCFFADVKNVHELMTAVRSGQIACSLINAEMVYSVFQLLAAANRALHAEAHGEMSTKNVHTELVYALSPSTNISLSLETFGVNDATKNIVVALYDDMDGVRLTSVLKLIKATAKPLDQLKTATNMALIREVSFLCFVRQLTCSYSLRISV